MIQSTGLYSGWRRERFGPFAGLSGRQAGALALSWLPALAAVGRSQWSSALQLAAVSVLVTVLVVVPIRRRPAAKWLWDVLLFAAGRALGWAEFRARAATDAGSQARLDEPDLPGVAATLRFHDGPPLVLTKSVCVVQDPRAGRWAATAQVAHPGLGNADPQMRELYAANLGGMLAAAAATAEITRLSIPLRTVPDAGAERAACVADHASPPAHSVVVVAADPPESLMAATGLQHEGFVTAAVGEDRPTAAVTITNPITPDSAPVDEAWPVVVEADGVNMAGREVEVELHLFKPGSDIKLVDLDGKPEVEARVEYVSQTNRSTSLAKGHVKVQTVEHVMAAFAGFQIDNAVVEVKANEPPNADGRPGED